MFNKGEVEWLGRRFCIGKVLYRENGDLKGCSIMDNQVQAFDEVAALMDERGMDNIGATLVATLMRKPARAEEFKVWLRKHPQATNTELEMQAQKIAKIVEPTIKR